jgi:deoxyribodipyrimidine photo-lyase
MRKTSPINIIWFRRDLRLHDHAALYHALRDNNPVLALFIFDRNILDNLEDNNDRRVHFIHQSLEEMQSQLGKLNSTFVVKHDKPVNAWKQLLNEWKIEKVFTNHDYEPYAIKRDKEIAELLKTKGVAFHTFKDQVIFEKNEVLKDDNSPYTVFTPYSRKWKSKLCSFYLKSYPVKKYFSNFIQIKPEPIPPLQEIGFKKTNSVFPQEKVSNSVLIKYADTRNFPSADGTSHLSVHLRFGTISVRELARRAMKVSETFLNELIWREFFMAILWYFPRVVNHSFRKEYDRIKWRNNEKEFEFWCEGKTGYPIVDAGMRELNETGFMHNRVRMIAASFLTKDLLIDWRWGEAYFAKKLLDYELSSNNGNWQWAAGTGCDAAPYFRIFNPSGQAKKFDPGLRYISKWIPELNSFEYPPPLVDHKFARERALKAYKHALAEK